jgi:hypothetical protein
MWCALQQVMVTVMMSSAVDLTEFVDRNLFGDNLSSPLLTRSGIHETPEHWSSFTR